MLELAALLVESDFARAELDQENLRAAREAERRAMNREIEAMRARPTSSNSRRGFRAASPRPAARHMRRQHLASGKRGPDQVGGGSKSGGGAAMALAEPAGQLLGGPESARRHRRSSRPATQRNGGLARRRNRAAPRTSPDHTGRVLNLVEGAIGTEQQGNFAILGNF